MSETSDNPTTNDSSDNDDSFDFNELSDDEKLLLAGFLRQQFKSEKTDNQNDDTDKSEFDMNDETHYQLPPELAERISNQVIRSIQAGDLGAELLRFGTIGLFKACLAMLGPALSSASPSKNKENN